MKKICFLIFICVMIFTVFAVPCLAEEAADVHTGEPESAITFIDRVTEFATTYCVELLSGTGIAVTLGAIIAFWGKVKKFLTDIIERLKRIFSAGEDSAGVQELQSKALNGIIDSVDAIDKQMCKFQDIVDAINSKQVETTEQFVLLHKALEAIAKMLDLVYANNKALPQGLKDMVHLYCAECAKFGVGTETETAPSTETEVKEDE